MSRIIRWNTATSKASPRALPGFPLARQGRPDAFTLQQYRKKNASESYLPMGPASSPTTCIAKTTDSRLTGVAADRKCRPSAGQPQQPGRILHKDLPLDLLRWTVAIE